MGADLFSKQNYQLVERCANQKSVAGKIKSASDMLLRPIFRANVRVILSFL